MSEVVDRAVNVGISLGASEVEARYSSGRSISVKIEANEVADASWKFNRSLGIAVIVNKKLGFSRTTDISKARVEKSVEDAYRLATSSKENANWKSLPVPGPYPELTGTFDERVASISPEEVVKMAADMMKETRSDSRVSVMGGGMDAGQESVYISNSNGIFGEDSGTYFAAFMNALAKEGSEISSFSEAFEVSRGLDIKVTDVGREAAKKALESLHSREVDSFKGTIVFDYDAAPDLIFGLTGALNGDYVWRGSSPLKDKLGQMVAIEPFSLFDEGTLRGGVATSKFDYEGVPRRKTPLIDRGVLKSFLQNTYTAGIMNSESTGNATGFLSVGPSNLVLPPGDHDSEEIIKQIRNGLLVKRFSGYVRPQDGLVSGSTKQTSLIRNGEVTHSVKECMISGNLYDFLKNISAMSKSVKRRGTLVTPQIAVENVSVVSKA